MRPLATACGALCLLALCLAPALAQEQNAQTQNPVVIPPAPPIVAAPPAVVTLPPPPPAASPPPGLVEIPLPPNTDSGSGPDMDTGAPLPDASAPPAVPNDWIPGKSATIGVLNKVDGSVSQIVIPTGGRQTIGDLQVNVQACATRPPDEIPDVAIFLAVQNTDAADTSLYSGWMVRSIPGAAVVGDATEIFRVINCS